MKIVSEPYSSGSSSGAVGGGFSGSTAVSGQASSGVNVFGTAHQANPEIAYVAVGSVPFVPPNAEGPHPAPAPTQIIKVSDAHGPSQPEQIIKVNIRLLRKFASFETNSDFILSNKTFNKIKI